jgi:hypothetical protein
MNIIRRIIDLVLWIIAILCWYLAWTDRITQHGYRHQLCPRCVASVRNRA